jgi:hypothetical protein
MSIAGALTIAEFPGLVLEVYCRRCDRRGRYVKARLVERFGLNLSLPDLLRELSPDCPARGRPGIESCSAIYPTLAKAFRATLKDGSSQGDRGTRKARRAAASDTGWPEPP